MEKKVYSVAGDLKSDERVKRINVIRILLSRPEFGALSGSILVFIFFVFMAGGSGMFSALGIVNFLEVSAQLGIIAVAACLLMIGGEFDLSVGSMIGFAGICIAIPVTIWGWPVWLAIIFAFLVAILVGYVNGVLVITTKLPSFIVTLAMLFILRGLAISLTRLITGRTQIYVDRTVVEADPLAWLFSSKMFVGFFQWLADHGVVAARSDGVPLADGIPVSIFWWIFLVIISTVVLVRTKFGNWIFAVGGFQKGAYNIGVPVNRVKIILFIFTACSATLFAIIQVLSSASADTVRGSLKEFEAIIASVIGGALLTGGYGSTIGSAFGALIFGTVQLGIFYTGIDTDWFKVFLGVMVLIAVIFNNFLRRKATGEK